MDLSAVILRRCSGEEQFNCRIGIEGKSLLNGLIIKAETIGKRIAACYL